MSYAPPALAPIVLPSDDAYTPPDLSLTVILGEPPAGHALAVVLPPPALPSLFCVAQGSLVLEGQGVMRCAAAARPLSAQGVAIQDMALPDADGPALVAAHGVAVARPSSLEVVQTSALHRLRALTPSHQPAAPRAGRLMGRIADTRLLHYPLSLAAARPLRRDVRRAVRHSPTRRALHPLGLWTQPPLPRRVHSVVRSFGATLTQHRLADRHYHGYRHWCALHYPHHHGLPLPVRLCIRWTQGVPPAPGRYAPYYVPPRLEIVLSGPYTPRPLRCAVVLGPGYVPQPPCPVMPDTDTIHVPILEHYVVINTFTLVRADTGAPIEALSFDASLDVDSWCWRWSASVPAEALPQLRPTQAARVELIATLNGTPLRLLVEQLQRARQFARATLTVSGRGRAAWLAAPYSPIATRHNAQTLSAHQLMIDALTINGVPLGWSIDWRLTDWVVPPYAWSHTGTYIESVLRIAESGGGYVHAHNTDQTLIVRPRYPSPPWHWAGLTPDITLPEDVCEVEGIEWVEKPDYNAVYITGGRRDRVIRTGAAGDKLAPTVVDALATAPEATRQRGTGILSDTGRQAHITLRLPVLKETGIIVPGALIHYTEQGQKHVGLSRAVSVSQSWPELWQSVRIETHESV